jgi:hypothetical protein
MKRIILALVLALLPIAARADLPAVNAATQTQAFNNLGAVTQISFGQRTVFWVNINNTQAATATFVQLFNSATTPTLGTGVIDQAGCPALSYCFMVLGGGITFPAGAWIGAATAANGSTAAASGNFVNVGFQ